MLAISSRKSATSSTARTFAVRRVTTSEVGRALVEEEGVTCLAIAGDADVEAGAVSFRYRDGSQRNGVPLAEAVARAWRAGLVVVTSAGNAGGAADDFKVIKLEQDVRRLEQQVRELSRQIAELQRRTGAPAIPVPRDTEQPAPSDSQPWLQARNWRRLRAGMSELEVIDEVLDRGMLEVLPLTHIRGRSLHDAFVIVDEAQSLERNVLLTVLSRIGANSKVVLTHDVAQRDNLRVGRHDGIVAVVERLKGHPLFAHVTLTRSERSPIAALVTEMLESVTV